MMMVAIDLSMSQPQQRRGTERVFQTSFNEYIIQFVGNIQFGAMADSQLTVEVKTLIHHILHKHKFYRLEMPSYQMLLELLGQKLIKDPHMIQQSVFRGIFFHNRTYRDNIASYLSQPRFENISHQIKQLLHKILHEFHFLYSIRAQELFESQYMQPGASLSSGDKNLAAFDDELEKYKLHSMYYGPFSIYNLTSSLPQQFAFPSSGPALFDPANQPQSFRPYDSQLRQPQEMKMAERGDKQSMQAFRSQQIDRQFGGVRGRPTKQKKKLIQRLTARNISPQMRDYLNKRHRNHLILEEKDNQLQYCACRGFLSQKKSKCVSCSEIFHEACVGIGDECIQCRLKQSDPFYKVVETLGQFFIYDLENVKLEEQMNMKAYENICSSGRFEVMISCTVNGDKLFWPDDCLFKINNEPVFQIPARLEDHATNRQDSCYFITPYIFKRKGKEDNVHLQKTRFSLEWCRQHVHIPRRKNNRKQTFLVGFYLIDKLNSNQLYKKVISGSQNFPSKTIFQMTDQNEQVCLQKFSMDYIDPFTQLVIQTPARSTSCKHSQCFDLKTYLVLMEASSQRKWLCPFCHCDARKLVIDKYQLRILEELNSDDNLFEGRVLFQREGGIIDIQGFQRKKQQKSDEISSNSDR